MDFFVISDIHGSSSALEKALRIYNDGKFKKLIICGACIRMNFNLQMLGIADTWTGCQNLKLFIVFIIKMRWKGLLF